MNKTIFVLLDACQYETGTRNLGFLEHMIDYGKGAKYKVKGELPSLSKPMYATLLSGVPACVHGIGTNEMLTCLQVENIFSLCKANGGTTAAAAHSWMSELFNHIPFNPVCERFQIHSDGSIDNGIFYFEDTYPDSHVFADGEYLRKTYAPDFIVYHTMAIDYWGHRGGAGSKEYELAVYIADHCLALALPQWLAEGCNVVVTADHGMSELGYHGGIDSVQRDTPLYIFSNQVVSGRFEDHYISQLNVAPLLCRLLGIPAAKEMLQKPEINFQTK